jgi:signal transduction histidine kinase
MPPYFPTTIVKMLVAVSCLTLAALYLQIYFSIAPVIERTAATDVQQELSELRGVYTVGGLARLTRELTMRIERGGDKDVYALAGRDEKITIGTIRELPWSVDISGKWRGRKQMRATDGSVIRAGYRATVLPGGPILLVGRNVTGETELGDLLGRSLLYSLGVVAISAILAALYFYSMFNRRMRAISDAAEDIMRGDFSRRVPVTQEDDEFSSLGLSINMMLDRIDSMMNSTRTVTDSIAHHVRGALMRVKTHVETLAEEAADPALRDGIRAPAEELNELLRIIDGLIEIARADAGLSRDQMRPVSVGRLVGDLVEIYGPLAEEHGIALRADVKGEWSIVAHEALLGQALSNLIENAIKYIGEGDQIVISAAEGPTRPVISIADNGPGIPVDKRSQAIARFSRLGDPAKKDGVGLGLSIVAAIARLHQAEFTLADNMPGLRATLRLPPKPVRPAFWRRFGAKRKA